MSPCNHSKPYPNKAHHSSSKQQPLQQKSCRIQWLLVYMVAVAAIGSNLRSIRILGEPHHDTVIAANRSNRMANAIDLTSTNATTLSESSMHNDSIGAFFDCNRNGSKCRYFYPGEFYRHYFMSTIKHNSSGSEGNHGNITRVYSDQQHIEWRKQIGLENANLPALDSLSWWMKEGDVPAHNMIQRHVNLSHNITYIHLHKCGGTSIQSALYKRARQIRNTRIQINAADDQLLPNLKADVHTYKHSFGGGSKEKKQQWDNERLGHIQHIASKQQQSQSFPSRKSDDFPLFTIVRDPIQRFLSAIQQVMHYNTDFRQECLHEPPSSSSPFSLLLSKKKKEEQAHQVRCQTIQCAIEYMEETHYQDVHLLPMASHFRLLDNVVTSSSANNDKDGGGDIAVSVFSMEDIQDVLLYLGNNDQSSSSGGVTLTNSRSKSTIHARDRSNVKYATSSILAKLSSNDCSAEMIHRICSLYHVDVALMRWLGFGGEAVERCR